MMTLQEIKAQVAQEHRYEDWRDAILKVPSSKVQDLIDDVAKAYAKAAIEADRKDCAEKAKVKQNIIIEGTYEHWTVDQSSILDRPYREMK